MNHTVSIPQRALVTGSGKRLGQAMAVALAGRGFKVALHYNSSSSGVLDTLKAVQAAGGDGALVQCDLSDEAAVEVLVEQASEQLGGAIGLLVNNAAVFEEDDIEGHSKDSWDNHMAINLRAPIRLSQSFAEQLPASDKGLIVNVIDQRVWKLAPTFFSYTLSKSALWTATRTMAQGLAPNIRVNAIGPGPTLQNDRQAADDFDAQVKATLTQEGANPEDIARALLYFVEANAVTGQMLAVDGGQHLIWRTPDIDGVVE